MKKLFSNLKYTKSTISINTPLAHTQLAKELINILLKNNIETKNLIILCIGTDRSTGDSLGPLVGNKLEATLPSTVKTFGTLSKPVHAVNLNDKLEYIKNNFSSPYIIAIDACLGKSKNIGKVNINEGPLKPGTGVNKSLPEVGHCQITGTVNVGGFMEFWVLQNTRLNTVFKLSLLISRGIFWAVKYLKEHNYLN